MARINTLLFTFKKVAALQTSLVAALLFFSSAVSAQIMLDQNVGDIVPTSTFICNTGNNWGRVFELQDFGVPQNRELSIDAAEIAFNLGIYNSDPIFVRFNVYIVDDNFSDSFPQADLLGSSQTVELKDPTVVFGTGAVQILSVDFDDSIIVPKNTKRILVEAEEIVIRPNRILIASTENATDSSWFHPIGCAPFGYVTAADYGFPETHYYIKAFGELIGEIEPEIAYKTNCNDLSVDFGLTNADNIAAILWDFGDSISGADNSSTDFEPEHEFRSAGIYTVKAIVTTIGGEQIDLVKSVEVAAPVEAYPVATIVSCEDTPGTGISSTFDTSFMATLVLGGQTGMEVSYFDSNGTLLPNPLPNPFRNTEPGSQTITIRVTDPKTNCFDETQLRFDVRSIPMINRPADLFACDTGDGHATFDTSSIELQLISGQTGLDIEYFDIEGNELPSPLPQLYQNRTPFQETIFVRVANEKDSECFFETSFDLIVNEPLDIGLEEKYDLCSPDTNLNLVLDPAWDFWQWSNEDGTLLSNTHKVDLNVEGNYSVWAGRTENGLQCEKVFSFRVEQPEVPSIEEIRIGDFSSNNTVEVLVSGAGIVEYSIDGQFYQLGNVFLNVEGGEYTIHVRNIDGCGIATKKIFVLDYPKFFTPNNDGVNDLWHINGIQGLPNIVIYIFDRYGKFLKQLSANDPGWDGTLNGRRLPSSDYWFILKFLDGQTLKRHFALKR